MPVTRDDIRDTLERFSDSPDIHDSLKIIRSHLPDVVTQDTDPFILTLTLLIPMAAYTAASGDDDIKQAFAVAISAASRAIRDIKEIARELANVTEQIRKARNRNANPAT